MTVLVSVKDLSLRMGSRLVLEDLSFDVKAGEIFGLIGPSGVGKSMAALAIMGLAPRATEVSGEILFEGENLLEKSDKAMCDIRGAKIAMIFQEPMTALNPLQSIGAQVAETVLLHSGKKNREANEVAVETLRRVGLDPDEIPPSRYPHELSGGQRQRVVIAIAVAMKPALIIADEPTTALDVTTQAKILALLKTLCAEDGAALILITHNAPVIRHMANRVLDLGAERQSRSAVANSLQADPSETNRTPNERRSDIVLSAQSVSCNYALARRSFIAPDRAFRAVDNVSFELRKGETVGLVGESGCGKSTLAQALLGLHPLHSGAIEIAGQIFPCRDAAEMRRLRRQIQIVFQDPYGSFNPRMKVGDIIAEPFHLYTERPPRAEQRDRAAKALTQVGLPAAAIDRYPHAFSGGERQRIAIARALVTRPSILVLDEPTSALDAHARDSVLALLARLSRDQQLAYLFITHDLSLIRNIADRVLVMKNGAIVEGAETEALFSDAQHPYTRELIDAALYLSADVA